MLSWLKAFFSSSIGMKHAMAVTGTFLSLFVVAHLSGNLLVYAGPELLNKYAAGLKAMGPLLWVARLGLLGIFVAHLFFAWRLYTINKNARPYAYAYSNDLQLSLASKTMPYTGALIFVFVLYHLAHFTFHWIYDTGYRLDALGRHDVYFMVVSGFQNSLVALTYVVAMFVLGLHLNHGVQSVFQTLGLNHPRYNSAVKNFACLIAWGIAFANMSMPLAVWVGLIKLN